MSRASGDHASDAAPPRIVEFATTVQDEQAREVLAGVGESNYGEVSDRSVRGLPTYQQAVSICELTSHSLVRNGLYADHIVRIEELAGFFDVIVFKRLS